MFFVESRVLFVELRFFVASACACVVIESVYSRAIMLFVDL